MTNAHPNKPRKILLLTSSGGGGLIQTANAKEQETLAQNPNVVIVRRDILKDWVWKPVGNFFIHFWNRAQLKGDIPAQMICFYGQVIVDFFLHPVFFLYALRTAFKEDIDYIIDTQPLGTSAIIKALRIFNRKRGKNVRLEKVLVDLPTRKAIHFFRSIKKLSVRSRPLLKLTSIAPMLERGETEEQFWQETCKLSAKEINLEEVYVRQAFKKFKSKERTNDAAQIQIAYKNEEELKLIQQSFERGPIQARIKNQEVEFLIEPEDRVFTILLGSQPSKSGTFNYVKQLSEIAKECKERVYVFAFCANHSVGEETLLKKVSDYVVGLSDYPKNLSIIPFSFQNEHVIAPLFARSDATCTRSGGQTAMELMCVSTGEIWIHSEAKNGRDLLKGISGWEAASAIYLQKVCGAKIVTPDTFIPFARQVCQTGSQKALTKPVLESTA